MNKELDHLLQLLQLEREEDLEQYKKLIERLPLHERKEKGYTWYPVQVVKKGYTIGDRAFVVIEKGGSVDDEHHFRSGKTVRLFSQLPAADGADRNGVIHYVDKNKMKIILNSRELPQWVGMGQVGVDLLFDDRTYVEMEKAIKKLKETKNGRLAELKSVLMGKQPASFREITNRVEVAELNESQNEAVNEILAARDVAVVHGPPGTGKTTTMVQAVKLVCEQEPTVLVTAPSNTAVDLLTERLVKEGLNVVRIGNISRVDEEIIGHSLEVMVMRHPDAKNIKDIKKQAAEARRKAGRYKRKFGREEYLERKELYREANELRDWANRLEDQLIDRILDGAQVITCTLVGASQKVLDRRKYRTVFIDEAAQALEPASWIPILKASKVVLAGDPFQLPPTVKSMKAEKGGFNVTLIEKCLKRMDRSSMLKVQYRMNEQIMGFSNQQFYGGQLKADAAVRQHRLEISEDEPVVFVDTAGCGFEEQLQPTYQSRFNPDEFQILCEHLYQLIEEHRVLELPLPEIALISPYREQVMFMKNAVEEDVILQDVPLVINTIDGFQGQEKDVVYISLVRSNGKGEVGFLNDYRRMNVALTRARKKLVVVGDSATIGSSEFYQAFLEYCEQHGSYRTAWEYMRTS
jgi:ATP-dependent RNA/DNA helicase IGHMBP2